MAHRRYKWVMAPMLGALIFCLAVSAQVSQVEKVDQEMMKKIREEGMQRSQVMETLSWLTDVHGPRLTNSPQYNRATEWAKGRLAEWGLQNASLEAWGPFGRGWMLEGFTANIVKPDFIPLIAYPKAWSPSTNGVVRGQVVYLDAKTPEDLEKYKGKLKGAIVLVSPPREVQAHFKPEGTRATDEELLAMANAEPPSPGGGGFRRGGGSPEQRAAMELMSKKWQMVYDEGAAVALDMGRGDGGTIFVQSVTMPAPADASFDRRPRPQAPDAKAIPQASLAAEHYNRIVRMLTKGVPVELEVPGSGFNGPQRHRRNPRLRSEGRDSDGRGPLRFLAFGNRRHGQRRGVGRGDGGRANPSSAQRQASPDDPHRAVGRRGGRADRISRLRRTTFRLAPGF